MLIHSKSHDARDQAVEACRFAAEKGATRIPPSVHFGNDLSDTTITRCVDAMEAVHARREPVQRSEVIANYTTWLADNVVRLGVELDKVMKAGGDVSAWLKSRFSQETGEVL